MRVGYVGFVGTGNIGDLAMAEATVKALQSWGCHVTVYVCGEDQYDRTHMEKLGCKVLSDRQRYDVKHLDALVLGGGEAGVGFGWQLAAYAHWLGVPVVTYGQSYRSLQTTDALMREFLRMQRYIVVRDEASYRLLRSMDVNCVLGADPVFSLKFEPAEKQRKVAIYVRHPNSAHTVQSDCMRMAEQYCDRAKLEVVYVACDYDDVCFMRDQGRAALRMRTPQEHLQLVSSCQAVIAVGRYHPAVFAVMTGTRCIASGKPLTYMLNACSLHNVLQGCACIMPVRTLEWQRGRCEEGLAALKQAIC